MVEVDVAGELEFSDRSKVLFKNAGQGYVPFVRFYTNDANTVRIGCEVMLNGTLTAPHGDYRHVLACAVQWCAVRQDDHDRAGRDHHKQHDESRARQRR